MKHSIDLNDNLESKARVSISTMGDHKKFRTAGDKYGEVHVISIHRPDQETVRIDQISQLTSVDEGGKKNAATAKHIMDGLKRDDITDKTNKPEFAWNFDNAISATIAPNLANEGCKRPDEHVAECKGHLNNGVKRNVNKNLDEIFKAENYEGMFISKRLY